MWARDVDGACEGRNETDPRKNQQAEGGLAVVAGKIEIASTISDVPRFIREDSSFPDRSQ